VTRPGRHARPPSAWRAALTVLVALGVLAVAVWSGGALLRPGGLPAGRTPGGTGAPPTDAPALTTAAPSVVETPPPPAPLDNRVTAFEAQVVALANQERASAGCSPLASDGRLAAAARAHSADMARREYFDHDTPEGVGFATRITNAGYDWSAAAENIAAGQPDPAAVMEAWMNSEGHRHNILNCRLRDIGVGLAYGTDNRPYWTQDFGAPA
jgi:uncharacterized protein YkwD